MQASIQRLEFEGSLGTKLAARLDLPAGQIRGYALFAHCFTCSKDLAAARRVAGELATKGFAVLRFDFTGLGSSEGEFANTNFSSNVADLIKAADYMRQHYQAPAVLIGHSLGGAAVLAAAGEIEEVKAVATIGAPAHAEHVVHNFGANLDIIEQQGEAEVNLAGRKFTIQQQFVEDLREQNQMGKIASLRKALLVLHSPIDATVGVDNAAEIFTAAKHPKSFVSLDQADHLLNRPEDAAFAADVIASWASRYVEATVDAEEALPSEVLAEETRAGETYVGKFQNRIRAGRHEFIADEPISVGGMDSGPSPYDFLSSALAACTSMTLRMYANFKSLPVDRISVEVDHAKVHAEDCAECELDSPTSGGKIDRFERRIHIEGNIDEATRQKLLEIADKCPVHRTLESDLAVVSKLGD